MRGDHEGVGGRVALVTGAGGGIGRAAALALSQAGYRLAVTDRNATSLAITATVVGDTAADDLPLVVEADVTEAGDVEMLCSRAEVELGPVDVLVNAAGIYGERVPFLASDTDAWWKVVETNLRGPMWCIRRVLPGMVQRRRGHVVNVNSRAATWDDPGQSSVAYSVSKAALARLTGAVAAEIVGTGVIVVDVSPGMVRTDMTASRPDIDQLPDSAFHPASAAAAKVVDLASGHYDVLHGRFIHVSDDLDELVRRLDADPAAVPDGGGKP